MLQNKMDKKKLIEKIIQKKEFSQLPKKDIDMAFEKFDKDKYSDEEKVKKTRELLHRIYTGFLSGKLLVKKVGEKDAEWFLKKHMSTRERFEFYEKIYDRIFKDFKGKKVSVIDLGAATNGFSYNYFKKSGLDVSYLGIEGVGQLVDVTNEYFKIEEIKGKTVHLSLFELDKVVELIKKQPKPRVVLMFKMIGPLEAMKPNYFKDFVTKTAGLVDRFVVSFGTKTMGRRLNFTYDRKWPIRFLERNYKILDMWECGGEKYIVFERK